MKRGFSEEKGVLYGALAVRHPPLRLNNRCAAPRFIEAADIKGKRES